MRSHYCILWVVIFVHFMPMFPLWPVCISLSVSKLLLPSELQQCPGPGIYPCAAQRSAACPHWKTWESTCSFLIPLFARSPRLVGCIHVCTENMCTMFHVLLSGDWNLFLGPGEGLSPGCLGDRRHWPWFASLVVHDLVTLFTECQSRQTTFTLFWCSHCLYCVLFSWIN